MFWRFCFLPEILSRWFTRKGHLINSRESNNIQYSCLCMRQTEENYVKCNNVTCPIINFHPSRLKLEHFSFLENYFCPFRFRSKKDKLPLEVCLYIKKVTRTEIKSLLKYVNSECSNSTYFHLDCLNPKRRPNNYKTNWLCSACHTSSS